MTLKTVVKMVTAAPPSQTINVCVTQAGQESTVMKVRDGDVGC